MKHQDFRDELRAATIADALSAIEAQILPSLTLLIESAAGATPGADSALRADELRALALELQTLGALLDQAPPVSTDAK